MYNYLVRKAQPIIAKPKENIEDKAKKCGWSPNHPHYCTPVHLYSYTILAHAVNSVSGLALDFGHGLALGFGLDKI